MTRPAFFSFLALLGVMTSALSACQTTPTPHPPSLPPQPITSTKTTETTPPVPLFQVKQACAGKPWRDVAWVHVHENETTSWQVAQAVLAQQGMGCVYGLQHGGSRNVVVTDNNGKPHQFDPNRMFTQAGRVASLHQFGSDDPAVANHVAQAADDFYRHYLQGKKLIVAVHNNHEGSFSIRSYTANGALARNAQRVFINPQRSVDDFLYVVNPRAFDYFQQLGINVVLQDPSTVNDDGSLSVYAAEQGQDYINVEAGFGHAAAQTAMLEAVLAYMHEYYALDTKD